MIRAALVPVKPLHRAKDRLRPALGRRARVRLTRAMLFDVLQTLDEAALFVTVAVVTRDRSIRRLCRRAGIHTLTPPTRLRGLNPELTWAASQPEMAQSDRLLVLPGDVSGVSLTDLFRLVLPPFQRGVRLAPSPDGGTNALLLVPPGVIPFRFGPNSAARHAAEAAKAGVSCDLLDLPSLALDIDHPTDLLADGAKLGPRTRRTLAALRDGRMAYRRRARHAHGVA